MTHPTWINNEFASWAEAHRVSLESDYAYEEEEVRKKKAEIRRLQSLAKNLETDCEVHIDNMHRIAGQIKDLREALK